MARLEDSKIIGLFYARSEQAIDALAKKYGAAVRKVASNILRSPLDVEECVNDTYMGCWDTIPPQSPAPLITYVCKIARNLAIKKYHGNTAAKRNSSYDVALDELEEYIPALGNVEGDYEAKELSASISAFLNGISYDNRFMFVRRYWYGDTVSDIAASMGIGSHYVSVRLSRTRKKLQSYLIKEGWLI